MHDIEIKNATILDGLGNQPYQGNIYVKDGRIVVITHQDTYDASISLDATGKIVTPGFIDLHTHSDISFLLDSTAQSKVRQGVTLELIGNCGLSLCAPLIGDARDMFDNWVSDHTDAYNPTCTDYAGYIEASKKAKAT